MGVSLASDRFTSNTTERPSAPMVTGMDELLSRMKLEEQRKAEGGTNTAVIVHQGAEGLITDSISIPAADKQVAAAASEDGNCSAVTSTTGSTTGDSVSGLDSLASSDRDTQGAETEHELAKATSGPHSQSCRTEGVSPGRRRVSFDKIEIRYYPVVLGDHPDCKCGPPLSLGWKYYKVRVVSVDEYEMERGPGRRYDSELEIPPWVRKNLLRVTSGHSNSELNDAIEEVSRVKRQRQMSRRMYPLRNIEGAFQSAGRKLKIGARR